MISEIEKSPVKIIHENFLLAAESKWLSWR
jgi:hypothetical protein